ncbi:Potassium channel tetramerization-type btb domain, partial [Globisporangium splendens]
MFTERSVDAMTCDDDGYDVEEMQSSVRDNEGNAGVEEVPDESDQQDADQETNGADPMNEDQDTDNDKKQHQDEQQPALISLAVSIVEVSSSFAQSIASGDSPEISSRMVSVAPREINASSTASPSSKATSLHSPELRRIVTFDVGGKLFRCKESLIRKYPLKRLNQVITCGCEQIHGDTFFIDRNPQHFEIVLDWYRTGTYIWHPLVNEAALKEDAKCFDVYNDLFPQRDAPKASTLAPPVPARSQRRLLPQAASSKPSTDDYLNVSTSEESPSRSAASHQSHLQHPATQVKTVHDHSKDKKITTRFSKIELWKVVWSGVPVVHMVRHHEQLVVASVKGHGMLLVRVCDATGVQTVHVDHAVLFDRGFTYTFWMELVPDSVARATAAGCSSNGDKQTNGAGDSDTNGSLPRVSADHTQLDVEFKLLASFQGDEKLADSVGDEPQCLAGTRGEFGERVKSTLESFKSETTQAFSPFLFLPPRHKGHSPASPLHELQS